MGMGDDQRNGAAADTVEGEVVVEAAAAEDVENGGEPGGGLKPRRRKSGAVDKEGELGHGGGAEVDVVGEHARNSSVYLEREQGIEFSDEMNRTGLEEVDQLITDKSLRPHETDCISDHAEDFPVIDNHHHHHKDVEVENQPTPEEECRRTLTEKEAVSRHEEVMQLDESKSIVEMDLERILDEQETHDLYCPNCHSCITKRVILRKRKRIARGSISDAKREKIETVQGDLDVSAAEDTVESHDTEPDVFRCLSCLSFFIPTGTGFRLFKIFGKRDENESLRSSQQMAGRNKNWMFPLFGLMKRKDKETGLGDVPYKGKEVNTVSFLDHPQQSQKHLSDEIQNVSLLSEQLQKNISGSIERKVEHVEKDSVKYVKIPHLFENIQIKRAEQLLVSKEGSKGDGIISIPEGLMKPIQEIYSEGLPKNVSSITTPVAPDLPIHSETRIHLGEQTIAVARVTPQWDVLKAIVYGGLLESVASLGVISSAAGSDVTTLNVIALGLANLVGGLLVMIHNLVELKNEQYKSSSREVESDHYWELLGRRGYFGLHATVALISYILVGILPPIIYGFSFRKSDNKEYKMIVVAGASLLCIGLLAIGKAHVQEGRKTYIKTFLYYIGSGVAASGLSYAIGMLIKKLLENLSLFDDAVVVPTPFSSILGVTSRTPSWQSY